MNSGPSAQSATQLPPGEQMTGDQRPSPSLLKVASDVAALIQVIVQMSDDVTKSLSPLDHQGRLLRLHNSIQKNRPRAMKHVRSLCDMIDAEKPVADHQSDAASSEAVNAVDGPNV